MNAIVNIELLILIHRTFTQYTPNVPYLYPYTQLGYYEDYEYKENKIKTKSYVDKHMLKKLVKKYCKHEKKTKGEPDETCCCSPPNENDYSTQNCGPCINNDLYQDIHTKNHNQDLYTKSYNQYLYPHNYNINLFTKYFNIGMYTRYHNINMNTNYHIMDKITEKRDTDVIRKDYKMDTTDKNDDTDQNDDNRKTDDTDTTQITKNLSKPFNIISINLKNNFISLDRNHQFLFNISTTTTSKSVAPNATDISTTSTTRINPTKDLDIKLIINPSKHTPTSTSAIPTTETKYTQDFEYNDIENRTENTGEKLKESLSTLPYTILPTKKIVLQHNSPLSKFCPYRTCVKKIGKYNVKDIIARPTINYIKRRYADVNIFSTTSKILKRIYETEMDIY